MKTGQVSKIILDVDTGTDDAMAIITAIRAFRDRILAITVTHGNRPLDNTLENTLRVVQFMGEEIPVYAGMPGPIVQQLSPGRLENQRRQNYSQEHNGQLYAVHDDFLVLPQATLAPQSEHAVSYLGSAERLTKPGIPA